MQRTNGTIKGGIHGFTWNTIQDENAFTGRFAHGKKSRTTVQAEDIVEISSSKIILKQFQRNQRQHPRGLCQAPAGCRGFEMETAQKFLKYSPKKRHFHFSPSSGLDFPGWRRNVVEFYGK